MNASGSTCAEVKAAVVKKIVTRAVSGLMLMLLFMPLHGENNALHIIEQPLRIKDLTLMRVPVDVLFTINQQGRPACLSFTLHSSRICTRGSDFSQRLQQDDMFADRGAAQYLLHCREDEVVQSGHWCQRLQHAINKKQTLSYF